MGYFIERFLKSRIYIRVASTKWPSSKDLVQISRTFNSWGMVDRPEIKLYCLLLNSLLVIIGFPMCFVYFFHAF